MSAHSLVPEFESNAQNRPGTAPERGGQADTAAPPPKQRDAFFDNAKFLAIVLVVCAHTWEPLMHSGSRATHALYILVYSFHMPAFIVISGYFSRSFTMRPAQLKRLVTGIVVPYVVFEVAYSLADRWWGHDPDRAISVLDPWFLTWFLASLFIWRMTTPLWRVIRMPVIVALVVGLTVAVSPHLGGELDLYRTLEFLPFFVLGLMLKPEHFDLVRSRGARIAAVPLLLIGLAVYYRLSPTFHESLFFRRDSMQSFGYSVRHGLALSLLLYGVSLLFCACFLALVPRRKTWFTSLGAGTLYGYLLHGFILRGALAEGWFTHHWIYTPLGEVAVTVIAAAVVTALCSAPVRRVFRCVMEPEMRWAFRQDDTPRRADVPAPTAER